MIYKVFLAPTKNIHPSPFRNETVSFPEFITEAEGIVETLRKKKLEELVEIMGISTEIATINHDRFIKWKKSKGEKEAYHAISMYAGEAFKAFDFKSLPLSAHQKLQNNLFILSGLYGILKPFDLVYPYRLEIGLGISSSNEYHNFYAYWKTKVFQYLDANLSEKDVLVNLSSQEYSKVINFNDLRRRVIVPSFMEIKKGKPQVVSFFSKNARGKMARFIIDNAIQNDNDLKSFSDGGYSYDPNMSTTSDWVFIR
jgi:cytoplasmic iron level regulating protein YaaA (DUF328/UPF0246 family)